ncbi:unnamed protein product [Microthlaspi erraticum]|uniref:Uncharacterized protein n=1 Tax=Microthlaspi erraticum TaxID=1685480 RepID=A0A6D2KQJ8_9BRAS|nr:unnamed protein product [Microthlaspi erraticum]
MWLITPEVANFSTQKFRTVTISPDEDGCLSSPAVAMVHGYHVAPPPSSVTFDDLLLGPTVETRDYHGSPPACMGPLRFTGRRVRHASHNQKNQQHEFEPEKTNASSSQWDANGLIGLPDLGLGGKQKSFADIFQFLARLVASEMVRLYSTEMEPQLSPDLIKIMDQRLSSIEHRNAVLQRLIN